MLVNKSLVNGGARIVVESWASGRLAGGSVVSKLAEQGDGRLELQVAVTARAKWRWSIVGALRWRNWSGLCFSFLKG